METTASKGEVVIVPLPEDDWTRPQPGTAPCHVCHNRRVIVDLKNNVKRCPFCTRLDGAARRTEAEEAMSA